MYPAIYWVEYWDIFDEEIKKASGCTFADTFTEAMEKIESYYGKDLNSVKLELLGECNILEFVNYKEAETILNN